VVVYTGRVAKQLHSENLRHYRSDFLKLPLVANYRRLEDPQARHHVGTLYIALLVFAVVIAHNFFVRNWTSWFGNAPPALFSGAGFVGEALLFLFIPLSLAYCVLTEGGRADGLPSPSGGSETSV
jgi:hypothetical protein